MKILALSFFPAFVPPSNGGEARLFYFYQSLSRWFDVTLLSSSHVGDEEQVIQHGPCFKERRIPKDEYFAKAWQKLQKDAGSGDLSAPCLAACSDYPTRIHLAYLQEYTQADVIIHESPFLIGCDLFSGIDHKPRIYNSYNAEFDLYSQLHPEAKSQSIRDLVSSAEKQLLQFSDLVFYCNSRDLELFKELAPDCVYDSMHVPHGAHPRKSKAVSQKSQTSNLKCVFMGSGHPPNVQAARFLIDSVAPQCPKVEFTIIGSCLKEGRYGKNVRSLGRVSDAKKNDILSSADLALNPMASGGGSNVKVLDYFAYGLPLISTPFGMRGIEAVDGKHFIEAPLENFAVEIKETATERSRLERIARNAHEFVARPYSWGSISERAAKRIQQLSKQFESKKKKQVLLVLNDYNSFTGIGGGCTRTRGLYEVASQWLDVVFLCFSSNGHLKKTQISERITVIEIPITKEHAEASAQVNSLFHVSADDIIAGKYCSFNSAFRYVYEQLRSEAKLIVVEHCYLAFIPYLYGDRFVYSSQNNELELKSELLRDHPLASELVNDVSLLEDIAVQHSACSVVVSPEDADSLLRGRKSSGPILVVPNGAASPPDVVEIEAARLALRKRIKERSVAFVGSAHMPNLEAAKYICEDLAPKLPEVEFHLMGSVCQSITNNPSNVVLWGVVSDATKAAILQSCAAAINPMASGGGSNIKLSDYMGNGLFTVSTPFGSRGYDKLGSEHLRQASLQEFSKAILETLSDLQKHSSGVRKRRRELFDEQLSIANSGQLFTNVLKSLGKKKRKVLFVTYRFTWPLQGGAEIHLEHLVRALGESEQFDIDVVTTAVSSVSEFMRFASDYSFDPAFSAPAMIPNLRYARFAVDQVEPGRRAHQLREVWAAQPLFEKSLHKLIQPPKDLNALAWGWADPEGVGGGVYSRWALAECGLQLAAESEIRIQGFAPNESVITAFQNGVQLADSITVSGSFELAFSGAQGAVEIFSSTPAFAEDPRPLSFFAKKVQIGESALDLSQPMLWQQGIAKLPANEAFSRFAQAAEKARGKRGIRLTDVRGPASRELESFISKHVGEYDLVVTHNSVFKPAVVAIQEAKKAGIPSILVPHQHLDDDFYHFPDVLECAQQADLVLAAPKAAVEFLNQRGCRSEYHTPGIDAAEQFTPEDEKAFRAVYSDETPFVLILGRKAGAKRYQDIIDAVNELNTSGISIRAVLIGPDDDKQPISSRLATYLGPQPRAVVRGALMSCVALCNMSSSESFGIVLLEAWMAGKPVVANKHCAAFRDLSENGKDALLVDAKGVKDALAKIARDPALAQTLGRNGKSKVAVYDWNVKKQFFVEQCASLCDLRLNDLQH